MARKYFFASIVVNALLYIALFLPFFLRSSGGTDINVSLLYLLVFVDFIGVLIGRNLLKKEQSNRYIRLALVINGTPIILALLAILFVGLRPAHGASFNIDFNEPNPDDTYLTSRLVRFTKDGKLIFPEMRLSNSPNEDASYDPITFAPNCAIWTIQTAFETETIPNKITAFKVPCR